MISGDQTERAAVLTRQVVFVADRMQPRLGIPKALELLIEELPQDLVELVVVSGAGPAEPGYQVTALGQPPGWLGRLRAVPRLRSIAKARSEAGAVLIAVGAWAFVPLAAATVCLGPRLVLWEHTILPWRLRNEWRVGVVAFAMRLLAFRIQRVVCVSEANRAAVAKIVWPFTRHVVIPNSIGRKPPMNRSGSFSQSQELVQLLGIGALTRGKNWSLAIRAMRYLPENYVLDIVGDGNQLRRLNKLIARVGLSGRVQLLGYLPDAEQLISAAHVILHPSFAETFGFVMVEAASRDRPVVVLDMPAMNEMVPALVCGERSLRTPQQYAQAILRATRSNYDYRQSACARARYFDTDAISSAWTALIAGLRA